MFYNLLYKNVSIKNSIFEKKNGISNQISFYHFGKKDKKYINNIIDFSNFKFFLNEFFFFFLQKKEFFFYNLLSLRYNKFNQINTLYNLNLIVYYYTMLTNLSSSIFFVFLKKNNRVHFCMDYVFYKWCFIELNKKNSMNYIKLPVRTKKYTVLRSPFIFKKGREQFEKRENKVIFNYSYLFSSKLFNVLNKYSLNKSYLTHRYYL